MTHMSKIPIFLISLQRSILRRKHMEFQFARLQLPYRYVDAIDGYALDTDTKQKIQNNRDKTLYKKPFTDGEIGCALSHLAVYKKIKTEHIPYALIIEDDVFIEAKTKILLNPPVLSQLPLQWDMVLCAFVQRGNIYSKPYKRAHMRYWKRKKIHTETNTVFTVGIPTEFCYHTAGYLVSYTGACKLYEEGYPMRMPADILTGNARNFGLEAYALKTPCIRQHIQWAQDSTIKFSDDYLNNKNAKQKITTAISSNTTVLHLAIRIYFLCKNMCIAIARGHVFPVRFLRKCGIVPIERTP